MDKNGVKMEKGDLVKIEGGYFKKDNGFFIVEHAPGDEDWSGGDWCLKKAKRNGEPSTGKYNTAFWPIMVTVSDRYKRHEARHHNKQYATIEVVRKAGK